MRCNEDACQVYHNVLKFSKLKCLSGFNKKIGRSLTCMKLHRLLRAYTPQLNSRAPRAKESGAAVGLNEKPAKRLFDELRAIEARAAHLQNASIKLGGNVEVQRNVEGDGTVLRKMYLSKKNSLWQNEIMEAEKALKRRGVLPTSRRPVWVGHIRYAAVCERGGPITIARLPTRVVSPHGPPPPEAFEELAKAGLLLRCDPKCNLFTDGARSWPKLVKAHNRKYKARVKLHEVVHLKGQFCKTVQKRHQGQSTIAGTESIDSRWMWVKAYVPTTVVAKRDGRENPLLDTYVFSYQYRVNTRVAGKCLWSSLGALVREQGK